MAADPAADPAAAAAPAPAPDLNTQLSALYKDYDPQGAMGGLFAPAYIHGLKASEDAVSAWQAANHPVSYGNIDQTRMPNAYQGPSAMSAGNGVYGGPIPLTQVYGDQRGIVDPEALRVLAQGGKYDFNARRDAIAQRLASNTAAQTAAATPAVTDNSMFLDENGQPFDIQAYQQALAGGGKNIQGQPIKKSMFPIQPRGGGQDYNNVGA